MCSRFQLDARPGDLLDRFGLSVMPPYGFPPALRPTDPVLCVLPGGQARTLRWGFAVDWDSRPLINARAETLAQKPAFRPHLGRRVLVPASAWTEWRVEGAARFRTTLRPPAGSVPGDLVAMAGIVDDRNSVTLITCAAAPSVAGVHDRMPVLLASAEAEGLWLRPGALWAELRRLLVPYLGRLVTEEEPPVQPDLF